MIHSARPIVSPVVNIVFAWNLFCFARFWKVGTDVWTEGQHVRKQWSLPAERINLEFSSTKQSEISLHMMLKDRWRNNQIYFNHLQLKDRCCLSTSWRQSMSQTCNMSLWLNWQYSFINLTTLQQLVSALFKSFFILQ